MFSGDRATGGAQGVHKKMNVVKSQAWRAMIALSALVAAGLVLEAGRRWF
ncbi:MAG: hypothetical protein H0V87_02670 [Chloroflexi bacterium]|nr:hypothetical protein [Chloroflexota bacterium]